VYEDQRWVTATPRGCYDGAPSINGYDVGVRCCTSREQLLRSILCSRREIDEKWEERNQKEETQGPVQHALHLLIISDQPCLFIC
jgi:hypothetical protein